MNLSELEIRALNEGDACGIGWQVVPAACPRDIARKIAEHRAKQIGYTPKSVETRESDQRERLAEIGL